MDTGCPPFLNLATATQFPRVEAHLERERELEFYRYYESYYSSSTSESTQQRGSDNVVRLASDSALTAFAQLGVIRLQARRSFITFFDRTSQYIFAEATRSLSLQTGAVDGHLDALWSGSVALPRSSTYCEHVASATICLQISDLVNGPPVTVIPDLADAPLFRHTVAKYPAPHPRFYCGVPIMSPNGFAIGVFCVLDDTPRAGLEDWQITMLKDMSTTVMSHLEMARAKSENARSRRMIHGLGHIARISPPLNSGRSNHRVTEQLPAGKATQDSETPYSVQSSTRSHQDQEQDPPEKAEEEDTRVHVEDSPRSHQNSDRNEDATSDDVNTTFKTAASTLNDVMEVSGVMFLDASISSFGGLVDLSTDKNRVNAPPPGIKPMSRPSVSRNYSTDSNSTWVPDQKDATVLGLSCRVTSHQPTESGQAPPHPMTEHFLQTLLKQYPTGKIWELHDERNLHDEDVDHVPSILPDATASDADTLTNRGEKDTQSHSFNRQGRRAKERRILRTLFPEAQHLAFSGLWDNQRKRWFAACFTWTFDPVRIFNRDFELPFLSTVGESVMAEIARLDVNTVTKAQNDLLSSLSHELRSPLHGILGCTECLRETAVDAFQESLISTAETCCKTLLGTMDHLLQYARINDLTQHNADLQDADSQNRDSHTSQLDVLKPTMSSSENDVDLSFIVEEVVETAFAGYDYVHVIRRHEEPGAFLAEDAASLLGQMSPVTKQSESLKREPLVIILDIERRPDLHWIFRTQAGAWRRVLLNLVTNSLKFTTSGYVCVSLKAIPLESQGSKEHTVVLTVTDSGKGMGTAFLKESLFAPFSKEESSAPGTGLGLRLVHDVITKMGGSVQVQSAPSQGCEVKISVPNLIESRVGVTQDQSDLHDRAQRTRGLQVNFFGPLQATKPSSTARDSANSWAIFQKSFKKMCQDWLGINVSFSVRPERADVYITTADIARAASDDGQDACIRDEAQAINIGGKPLLVMCDSASSARTLSQQHTSSRLNECTEYISQPCGPRKLIKAFVSCLDHGVISKSGTNRRASSRHASPHPTTQLPRRAPCTRSDGSRDLPRSQATEPFDYSAKDKNSGEPRALSSPTVKKALFGVAAGTEQETPAAAATEALQQGEVRRSSIAEKESTDQNTPKSVKPTVTVLLVDDNPVNLSILKLYMKKHGHIFKTATNGQEACQVYQDTHAEKPLVVEGRCQAFDFVFMDITMPIMDGLEATRQIRAFERKTGMRPANIVALTALASAAAQQEAFASGVDLFFTKPVSMKELTEIMKSDGRSRREISSMPK